MSVESLAVALHHSRAKGAAKLVLIGIANHDGDGGAWPSMATLAKYGAVNVRQARKLVGELESLGEVRRLVNAGGTHSTADHMRPNLYRFTLRCPVTCDRSGQHRVRDETILIELADLETPPVAQNRGGLEDRGAPVPQNLRTIPEPSITQVEKPSPSTRETPSDAASRYERAIAAKCSGWSKGRHDYNAAGYCNFCGSHRDVVTGFNPATGEVL